MSTAPNLAAPRPASVPWYIYGGAVAITCATIGGNWDIAWHRSIGRDAFLTAPHLLIYACGVIAAIICGYLIFATTFGHSERMRSVSVRVLGFRAPLGAFLAAWGGIAMLTSAPFDNFWHNAYGVDVRVISPPHTLLILGIRAVGLGSIFLILAAMNRETAASGEVDTPLHRRLQLLYLYLGGLTVGGQMLFLLEVTWDVKLHNVYAYMDICAALPILFAVFSQSSRSRWAATITASVYMVYAIAEILILPLFPATPKLGPVYYPVTHLVPAKFPVLIIVPALALDLLWQRTRSWKFWQIALVSGLLFTAVLVAVEWPFASFLLSKASENRFFGTIYFDYNAPSTSVDRLRQWLYPSSPREMTMGLALATLYASLGVYLGLLFGRWMKGVQR